MTDTLTQERDEARRIERQTYADAAKTNTEIDALRAQLETARAALRELREYGGFCLV